MKTEQIQWTASAGWEGPASPALPGAQLLLVFGGAAPFQDPQRRAELQRRYPKAFIFGCSTAGEIRDTRVTDASLCATAVEFATTSLRTAHADCAEAAQSFVVGQALSRQLPPEGLVHVLVLSNGLTVNGSELVRGLAANLPAQISITGGLAGDGGEFRETWVAAGELLSNRLVAVVGLYGKGLRVAYGSLGGWDPFGPDRKVTKARGNVLYELDGKSALELYKKYLGDQASALPASGLLFPLALRRGLSDRGVVRTILSVNEQDQSMTFAGEITEGDYARLMRANFDRLVEGAQGAAETVAQGLRDSRAQLALLISCVGRKMVLAQRIEEEVEAVREVLGPEPTLTGFYSYGEISPFTPNARCELHNQTMTITAFREE